MPNTKTIKQNNYHIAFQPIAKTAGIPRRYYFQHWVNAILTQQKIKTAEITIRIVANKESAYLNKTYRHKTGPTNVLSFPFAAPPGMQSALLGDLVICAPVVAKEAKQQAKPLLAH